MRQPGGISGALGAIRSLPIRSGTVNNHSVPWPSGAGKAGEKLKNQAPKRPQAVHRHPDTLAKANKRPLMPLLQVFFADSQRQPATRRYQSRIGRCWTQPSGVTVHGSGRRCHDLQQQSRRQRPPWTARCGQCCGSGPIQACQSASRHRPGSPAPTAADPGPIPLPAATDPAAEAFRPLAPQNPRPARWRWKPPRPARRRQPCGFGPPPIRASVRSCRGEVSWERKLGRIAVTAGEFSRKTKRIGERHADDGGETAIGGRVTHNAAAQPTLTSNGWSGLSKLRCTTHSVKGKGTSDLEARRKPESTTRARRRALPHHRKERLRRTG